MTKNKNFKAEAFKGKYLEMSILSLFGALEIPKNLNVIEDYSFMFLEPEYNIHLLEAPRRCRVNLLFTRIIEAMKLDPKTFNLNELLFDKQKLEEIEHTLYAFKAMARNYDQLNIPMYYIVVDWIKGLPRVQNSKRVNHRK